MLIIITLLLNMMTPVCAEEVIVLSGLDKTIGWQKAENW
jgi:hypothetical protein